MTETISLIIDPAHPSLAGHFPGDPIVPGAILLDHAIAHIERVLGRRVATISVAKFLAPVRPEQTVVCDLRYGESGRVTVTAAVAGATVFSLSVTLEREDLDDRRLG